MELMIETQCWENYGNADEPYWKAKGVDNVVVLDVPEGLDKVATDKLVDLFNFANDFYMESVTQASVLKPGTQYSTELCGVVTYADMIVYLQPSEVAA